MSNPPSPLDPFALWRDLLAQWEQGTNALVNRATESEAFSEGMHKSLGVSLAAKKVSNDVANRYLDALNVPSKQDVAALGERLQSIDERLLALTEMVESLVGDRATIGSSIASPPQPRRTRKPPALDDQSRPATRDATASAPSTETAGPRQRARKTSARGRAKGPRS